MLAMVLSLSACAKKPQEVAKNDNVKIVLSKNAATVDGTAVEEFDYTWHADPSKGEYYTGTEPDTDASVYIAHDIIYYPKLDVDGFKLVNYDGEQEYVYYCTSEENKDFIFSTLPSGSGAVPEEMMHSEEDAYKNPVLHITEPGTYEISGEWNGQIMVDLGDKDEKFSDENAKVTIIFNGVDVTCDVAPAFLAYSAFECDNTWEDQDSWSNDVDTKDAGVTVIVADGTENNFVGTNVFRLLKAKLKDENDTSDVPTQKKSHKIDGAFYSYVSMNIDGEEDGTGILNITSTTYEGLDSELHLTINGGNINIKSQDDGINVNEDHVSVFTMNGGNLKIYAGLGTEGDGIDSNGYIVINGGTLYAVASPYSDNGIDSDDGTEINGGDVLAIGSDMGGSAFAFYLDGEQQYQNRTAQPGGQQQPGEPPEGQPGGQQPGGQQPGGQQPGGQQPQPGEEPPEKR